MPFIYRGEVAGMDRSMRREDAFIHERMMRGLEFISGDSGSGYVRIVPTKFDDPPFDKADSSRYLALYATKELGLTLYEVERWLDVIRSEYGIPGAKCMRGFIDERRRFFREPYKGGSGNPKLMGGHILTCIIHRRET